MATRLWHDDVRPAPEGWVWARTNSEAINYLLTGDVVEISLDHDLGLEEADIEREEGEDVFDWADRVIDVVDRKGPPEETGLDLVKWMCTHNLVPETVRIHSWNPSRAREMQRYFADYGYDAALAPYQTS